MKSKPEETPIEPAKLERATRRTRRVFRKAWDDYHKYKPDNTLQLAATRAPAFEVGETASQRRLERARILKEQAGDANGSGERSGIAGPGPSSISRYNASKPSGITSQVDQFGSQYVLVDTARCGVDSSLRPTKRPLERSMIATQGPNPQPTYDWCTYSDVSIKRPQELLMPFLPYGWSDKLLEEHEDAYVSMAWIEYYRSASGEFLAASSLFITVFCVGL